MTRPPHDMDERFMAEALRQAQKGLGRTSPNPAVGAVIVRDGKTIAKGYHRKAGLPHAEVEALNTLGGNAPGGTLYVTLEPCNHHGRTPPCTEAILRSGITRVVVGMKDPNPNVRGGGHNFLMAMGIEVDTGVLEKECQQLNESFLKFVTQGRPFVTIKSALTLDGWTATATGHSKWVTNDRSRQFVHRLRNQMDAVMVGIGTILSDDPALTSRPKRGPRKDPMRIVVDTRLRIPPYAKVLNLDSPAKTLIVVGADVPEESLDRVRKERVSSIRCPLKDGGIDLRALLGILGNMSVTSVLVEGGARLLGSLLRQGLADKFFIFKAAKILGGDDGVPMASGPGAKRMDQCLTLTDVQARRFGEDVLITGYPRQRPPV